MLTFNQGLIQNADPADIELVKGLVEEQIGTSADEYRGKSNKNTLILMTLPISGRISWLIIIVSRIKLQMQMKLQTSKPFASRRMRTLEESVASVCY